MKPVILLVHKYGDGAPNDRALRVGNTYSRAVTEGGGVPVISAPGHASSFPEFCDGILFTGGIDLEPKLYGEERLNDTVKCDEILDRDELELFEAFRAAGKPMLGICRGIQTLNVALGGSLWQDIPSQLPEGIHARLAAEKQHRHHVTAVPGSLVHRLFGEKFETNSFHHQAARRPGEGLAATAFSSDGVIEAVEHKTLPIIGVQWHPERMISTDDGLADMVPLFEHFVKLCADYRVK